VAIIRRGHIVAVEDIAQMKSRSMHVIEVTFAEAPPVDAFTSLAGVDELRRDDATLRLQARDGIDDLVKAIARFRVVDLRTEQPSIEDAFLVYYADKTATAHENRTDAAS
jgi:ABC-2 type transport system ATP-binding protein